MSKTADIRVYVLIGENGDYVIARDRTDLADLYSHEFGGVPAATRTLAIAIAVAKPRDTLVSALVPEAGEHIKVDVS